MKTQSEMYLNALGATVELPENIIKELNTKGYTVIKNVIDPDWLEDMRNTIDNIVQKEGNNLAIEHHQEATATRIANLINKGTVWEKVWSHPLILSACRYVFQENLKYPV